MMMAGVLLLVSNSVSAEGDEDFYAGLQYGESDITLQGLSGDYSPGLVMGRFGKFQNDHFALEARMGFGLESESQTLSGSTDGVILDMGPIIGLYGVGHFDIGSKASIYGLIGVSYVQGNTFLETPTSRGYPESQKDNGISIGVGADIGIWNNIGLNLEYVSYINNSDFDISALGIGVVIGY